MSKAASDVTPTAPEGGSPPTPARLGGARVGDVVLYRPHGSSPPNLFQNGIRPGVDVLPAVIVRLWDPDTANLQVLCDGMDPCAWVTSAKRGKARADGTPEDMATWVPRD